MTVDGRIHTGQVHHNGAGLLANIGESSTRSTMWTITGVKSPTMQKQMQCIIIIIQYDYCTAQK